MLSRVFQKCGIQAKRAHTSINLNKGMFDLQELDIPMEYLIPNVKDAHLPSVDSLKTRTDAGGNIMGAKTVATMVVPLRKNLSNW